MGIDKKVASRLLDGESLFAAVFIAEPMSTAVGAGIGGALGAAAARSLQKGRAGDTGALSDRMPRSRSAFAVTDRRLVAFPYQDFKGLSKEGQSLGRNEVVAFELAKENEAMRPKLRLDLADGSQWSGRLESRKGADELRNALEHWLAQPPSYQS